MKLPDNWLFSNKKQKEYENNTMKNDKETKINSPLMKVQSKEEIEKNNKEFDEAIMLADYQRKYVDAKNQKLKLAYLFIIIVLIGVILFASLFQVAFNIYLMNETAGIIAASILLILFVIAFIVPIAYISRMQKFETNVKRSKLNESKRHNKKVCYNLAKNLIELDNEIKRYDQNKMAALREAYQKKNDKVLVEVLQDLYKTSIKKESDKIATKYAFRCGVYTALSQVKYYDTAIIVSMNITMMKDIIYLYGFRPNESQMTKLMIEVIRNVAVGMGISSISITNTVSKYLGRPLFQQIPVVKDFLTVLLDSTVEGTVNGVLSYMIGIQTRKCLLKEYELQKKLSYIPDVVLDEEDLEFTSEEIAQAENNLMRDIKAQNEKQVA